MPDKENVTVSADRAMRPAIPEKLKRLYPLLGMGMFPIMGMIYAMVNHPRPRVHSLVTAADTWIPLIKVFAIPYSIWILYIYACVLYFLKKDRKVYYECLVTYALSALACYGIYTIFQTTVPRPVLYGDDPLTRLLHYIYGKDQPFNCFPSIHSFSSYMVMRALYKSNFKNKLNQILIYGMSTTIILSTFFIKQHVVFDALSAILLVEVIHRLVVRQSQAGWPILGKLTAQTRSL